MVKTALIIISCLVFFLLIAAGILAIWSHRAPPGNAGISNNSLAPCPDTPNCVCSESNTHHSIEPMPINGHHAASAWAIFKKTLQDTGGTIKKDSRDYVWACRLIQISDT